MLLKSTNIAQSSAWFARVEWPHRRIDFPRFWWTYWSIVNSSNQYAKLLIYKKIMRKVAFDQRLLLIVALCHFWEAPINFNSNISNYRSNMVSPRLKNHFWKHWKKYWRKTSENKCHIRSRIIHGSRPRELGQRTKLLRSSISLSERRKVQSLLWPPQIEAPEAQDHELRPTRNCGCQFSEASRASGALMERNRKSVPRTSPARSVTPEENADFHKI
jgi:hypothetical protein